MKPKPKRVDEVRYAVVTSRGRVRFVTSRMKCVNCGKIWWEELPQ